MIRLKTLLVYAFCFGSLSIEAQKISFDRIENDGIRHIGTEKLELKILKYYITKLYIKYFLLTTCYVT